MKNYTKYGPTGILWALYVIVGVVAFLVSNLYFKFELKDAIIFGVVNLVAVIGITEGIDFIFKKAKLRQERKAAEEAPGDEPAPDAESAVGTEAESAEDSSKDDATTEPSSDPVIADDESANDATPPVTARPEKKKGLGYFTRTKKSPVAEASVESEPAESAETEAKETAVDEDAPILITGGQGSGKNFHLLAHAVALNEAGSPDPNNKELNVDTDVAETTVEPTAEEPIYPRTVETATEPVAEDSSKPRGRRANPDAIIDAPTSSISVITPDMIKPMVAEVVTEQRIAPEPAVKEKVHPAPVVETADSEETYLSAEDFLNTTKLTSPRAIVREYQRVGGKDDIYSILMERQK